MRGPGWAPTLTVVWSKPTIPRPRLTFVWIPSPHEADWVGHIFLSTFFLDPTRLPIHPRDAWDAPTSLNCGRLTLSVRVESDPPLWDLAAYVLLALTVRLRNRAQRSPAPGGPRDIARLNGASPK